MSDVPAVYEKNGKWYHSCCGTEYGPFNSKGAAEAAQALHRFQPGH